MTRIRSLFLGLAVDIPRPESKIINKITKRFIVIDSFGPLKGQLEIRI